MKTKFMQVFILGLVVVTMPACSIFRSGNGGDLPASVEAGDGEHEDRLRALVDDSLVKMQRNGSPDTAQIVFRKPYFYKESVSYPDGIDGYALDIRASESLTTPYTAQVRLKKERFATKFHKKRNNARNDSTFFRSSGFETLSYELRNGRWREVGTLYVATETDPQLQEVSSQVQFEDEGNSGEKKGILGRLFFWRN